MYIHIIVFSYIYIYIYIYMYAPVAERPWAPVGGGRGPPGWRPPQTRLDCTPTPWLHVFRGLLVARGDFRALPIH